MLLPYRARRQDTLALENLKELPGALVDTCTQANGQPTHLVAGMPVANGNIKVTASEDGTITVCCFVQ